MGSAGLLRLVPAVLAVLVATMSRVAAQDVKNVAVGGDLVLELDPKPTKLTRVVWKHGADLAADMTQGVFTYYRSFKNHTVLEPSGRLTVSNIQVAESGEYSVEVNNVIQNKRYNVRVYEEVSRPTIRVTPLICGPGSEDCTLVCELDGEPPQDVTYEWELEGEEPRPGKTLTIDQNTKATSFTCRAKNPVSEAASEPIKNPLIAPPPDKQDHTGLAVGLSVLGVGVAGGGAAAIIKRKKLCKVFRRRMGKDTPATDPAQSGESELMNRDAEPNGNSTTAAEGSAQP